MKTKSLIIILIVISSFSVKSQTPEKISGFSDIKLSYNISFIKDKPDFIPFGTGLEFTYNISKKFSGDFGITFKPTGKKIEDIYYPGDWG
ncbi:MAG TPA: hypothetical protein VIK14_15790, partial [Ignavibacteria bacterium]